MLLLVVVGTIVAVALGLFLLEVVIDGVLQDPLARGFTWCAQHWFAYDEAGAKDLYQHVIRDNKQRIITAGTMVLMLVAFYIAMGKFTHWLDQIGAAVRQVVGETGEDVHLPRELAPVEADLTSIQRALRERETAAKESEQRRSDLVAFLAHDLKTPLTSVLGYLNLLHDEPDLMAEQRAKYTGIALDKAQRLEELISEFFDITRMDLKSIETGTPIQLSVLLEQLVDEFYPAFEEQELTCAAEIEPHLAVRGDPDKLARVFDNVLRNAVSYSHPGGQVDLEARYENGWTEIAIRNEGLTIPEQELTNIFNKFYRLDAARSTRTGGAGLGLAIAREIVERHGGAIRAESDGKRTSFVIRLPGGKEGGV
ncbi:MAG: HAMP domain-containing histidine kinase [Clostridia bacterium]|nr:HAMP domain-containing histidine kinase [Clostridia bacterium]